MKKGNIGVITSEDQTLMEIHGVDTIDGFIKMSLQKVLKPMD